MLRKRTQTKLNTVTVACILAFFLTSISYLPMFADRGMTQILSFPAWGFVIVAILLQKKLMMNRGDLALIFFALIVAIAIMTLQAFTTHNYFGSLLTRSLVLAFILSFLGEFIAASGKVQGKEKQLFSAFIAGTLVLCAVVYFTFLRGQNLNSLYYVYGSKNETAMLASTAVIFLLFYDWQSKHKKIWLFFQITLLAIFTVVIFLLRCRSVMIGVVLTYTVFFFRKNSSGWVRFALVVAVVVMVFALQDDRLYNTFVNGIVFAGRDFGDINALSSGRVDQIQIGLQKLNANLWTGTGKTGTVDCFYVSVLMQYGMVLGGAVTLFALSPLVWGIINYRRLPSDLAIILIMCAVTYSICGIFEENAPLGPGARCFVLWFLWGYLKMYSKERNSGNKAIKG